MCFKISQILPLSYHARLILILIFLEVEKEDSLAVHYVFKSRNVRRGHTKTGAAETGWKEVRLDHVDHELQL